MLEIYIMAGILLVLALTHTALLIYEYLAHGAVYPACVWLLLWGALIVDVILLKGKSIWFWVGLFL